MRGGGYYWLVDFATGIVRGRATRGFFRGGASFLFFRDILSFRLEAGGTSWERETPLLPKRGFPSPKPSPFPSTAWGYCPKTPLAPLARHGFRLQKHSHGLSGRIFVLQKYSQDFPGAVSAFGSVPKTFSARFWRSGAFPRLSPRVFGVREQSNACRRG